jgi:hypothetical protein
VVDLVTGEDARILHVAADGNDTSFDERQAYVQCAARPLSVIAGKCVTLPSADVINLALNTNMWRSLLFTESEPPDHTGGEPR